MDDRKKLGMDSANPQNCFERRGQAEPSIEKIGFKMDMIMMIKLIKMMMMTICLWTDLVKSLIF